MPNEASGVYAEGTGETNLKGIEDLSGVFFLSDVPDRSRAAGRCRRPVPTPPVGSCEGRVVRAGAEAPPEDVQALAGSPLPAINWTLVLVFPTSNPDRP